MTTDAAETKNLKIYLKMTERINHLTFNTDSLFGDASKPCRLKKEESLQESVPSHFL